MSHQVHPFSSICPNSPTPPEALIEAALCDVPPLLAEMENTTEYGADQPEPGERIVQHYRLVQELTQKRQHGKTAAEWAIDRLVEQGMLTIHPGCSSTPGVIGRDGAWLMAPITYELHEFKYCLIQSTPRLWAWWREQEENRANAGRISVASERTLVLPNTTVAELPDGETYRNTFRLVGEIWTLRFAAKTVHLKDTLGLKYLGCLLASKHRNIDAVTLRAVATRNVMIKPSAGIEILDAQALQQYKAEYESLKEQLEEAKEFNDLATQEHLQSKINSLAEQLEAARGLGNRTRKVKDETANVRTSIKNAITRTIEKHIQKAHPELARHFDTFLRTGHSLCYAPDPDVDWEL